MQPSTASLLGVCLLRDAPLLNSTALLFCSLPSSPPATSPPDLSSTINSTNFLTYQHYRILSLALFTIFLRLILHLRGACQPPACQSLSASGAAALLLALLSLPLLAAALVLPDAYPASALSLQSRFFLLLHFAPGDGLLQHLLVAALLQAPLLALAAHDALALARATPSQLLLQAQLTPCSTNARLGLAVLSTLAHFQWSQLCTLALMGLPHLALGAIALATLRQGSKTPLDHWFPSVLAAHFLCLAAAVETLKATQVWGIALSWLLEAFARPINKAAAEAWRNFR
jgi:hypothetical protein